MIPQDPYSNPMPPSPLPPGHSLNPPPPSPWGPPPGMAPPSYPYGQHPGYPQNPYGQSYTGYESANGKLVLGLGIVSILVFQVILGPIVLFMANKGLKKTRAGLAHPGETGDLNAGRICGAIGSFIGAMSLILLANILFTIHEGSEGLLVARSGFVTHLTSQNRMTDPVPNPLPDGFHLANYVAPLGVYPAIIADPDDSEPSPAVGTRRPAIIWLTGGFSNEIDDTPWAQATPDNDQSASAFHKAGIETMYPSLRGGNNNPGYNETCYGEVDDVIAAAKYLASQPDVDSKRIYLGGHSTGGTLALLTAESTRMFRAVFSFGPVDDTAKYGAENVNYNINDEKERRLRAPIHWLGSISSPTYVIEGDGGNIGPFLDMKLISRNPQVHFAEVDGYDHFSELALTTPIIAQKIEADTGPTCNIKVDSSDWGN